MLDDFIGLAEADIWQRLRIRDMEARATSVASTSSRFLELPTGYQEMRRLAILTGGIQVNVRSITPDSMKVQPGSGQPKFFAVTGEIEFDRLPDSAYTVEMQYYRALDALSASSTSNAVLSRFPMVYLYGSLMHFGSWAQDEDLFNKYALLFSGAIDSANKNDRRGRHTPGAAMRIQGPTP